MGIIEERNMHQFILEEGRKTMTNKIVKLRNDGCSNVEICAQLGIHKSTVRTILKEQEEKEAYLASFFS